MTIKFLKELIENNARVILPEFGAFLVKDDGTGQFKPDNVSFSPFLRYNDGMLEDSLASKLSISKDEAAKKIKVFVESVKEQLLNENFYPIEGIGSLYRDNRGSILFTKSMEKPDGKPAEKTKAEKSPEKTEKQTEPNPEKKHKEETIQQEKVSDIKEVEMGVQKELQKATSKPEPLKKPAHKPKPIAKKPVKTKEPKIEPPRNNNGGGTGKAILIGSLIGIGLVVITISGWYLYKNDFFNKEPLKKNVEEIQPDTLSTQSVEFNDNENIAEHEGKFDTEFEELSNAMENEPTEQQVTPETQVPDAAGSAHEPNVAQQQTTIQPQENSQNLIPTSDGPFHLIVGSFRNIEYAEKFSADMKRSGYESRVIVQSSGMHAVTLGSYSTQQDALKAMDMFKMQHPNVWLLRQENE
ncbi:MAG TPA: SPOR domain-containing protein [Tenuifilaceae bacterium]|nr:SPOR domain-containing protein [Tenuifilaceae bacterium]HPJ45877.1 SPOR domain-containing protein [Tenuifilaceae bacterium]HPQ34092.1 SPOR domain-containing protein [Tenuifilaceae bacterium]HRX68737.1 SPOR domain-containing protein [Tenuifilaceae bacterium]